MKDLQNSNHIDYQLAVTRDNLLNTESLMHEYYKHKEATHKLPIAL